MSKAVLTATPYSATFTPKSIVGCQLWLDGADPAGTGVAPANNSTVATWYDKSGNGKNATQTTPASCPTFKQSYINGIGALYFTTSNLMALPSLTLGPLTIFVIGKLVTFARNNFFLSIGQGTDIIYIRAIFEPPYFGVDTGIGPYATTIADTNYHIFSYTQTSVGSFWFDGKTITTSASISANAAGNIAYTTVNTLGGWNGYPNTVDSVLSEVIIYNTALTTAQRQQVEGYLAWKWGLQASLPTFSGPTSITGCALWLDASDATSFTFSSGSIISVWKDKSASANHLNLVSVTTPSRTTDGGRSVVNFPMGAVLSTTNQISFTQSSAFFVVAKLLTMNTGYLLGFTNTSGASAAGDFAIRLDQGVLVGVAGGGDENDLGLSQYYTNGTFNTSFTSATYYNTYFIVDTTQPSTSSTTYLTLSSLIYSASRALNGNIAEVLYYPAGVTSTQRQQIEGYLAWKWGTQAALPASHPYSGGSPTHPYTAAAPTGASSRPAISAALVPAGAKAMSKTSYYTTFTPTTIAGCQLWLDGADASTVTGTTTVTAWNDKSDKGYRLVPGTGTTSYANKGITISSSYLYANGTVDLTTLTFFIVAKNIGTSYNQPFFAAIPNTTSTFDSTDGFGWYMDNGNQTRFFGRYINNTGQWITTTGLNTLNTGLYTVTGTSAGVYTQWNNGTLGNTVTSSSRTSTARGFTVGGEWYADGSAWNTYTNSGTIYEVIVYNTVLSTADRQKVEGYLAWKWGIQASLPTFTPKSITGCSLWYDAADTTTLALSGGNATSWTDKASGIVLTSGSPAYTTSNAYPLVRFSGSVTYTSSTNLPFSGVCTSNANFTSFIVAATSSSTGVNGLPLTVYLAGNASRFAPFVNADGSVFFDGATQGSPRLGGITQTLNTPQILTFSRTGLTTMYANVNGTQKATNNFTTPSNFSSGSYIIYMSQSGALWKGDMYEVLYYNVDLTTAQVQQVEGYLAWKWGLQASLPVAHPYYSATPAGHPYITATPTGASLRPALSAALVPAGVRSIAAKSTVKLYTQTFTYTGADQTFTVPAVTKSITVYMWAGGGGGGYAGTGALYGGAGAYVQGVLSVTPSSTLKIIVGGGGAIAYYPDSSYTYGGGGTGGGDCGSGGGRSAIRVSGATDDLVTVGAGGGSAYWDYANSYGGNGDSVTGTGGNGGTSTPYYGGLGGSQTAGGAVGYGDYGYGNSGGSKYTGGNARNETGGGGGAGYYGGGAGGYYNAGSGGGGGSSLTTNLTSLVVYNSPNRYSAPNTASPYYQTGVAAGGLNGQTGGNGLVVITYLGPV